MPRSANRARIADDISGDGGTGLAERATTADLDRIAGATLAQVLVEQERASKDIGTV